jgi:2,4-dienoyl-CoA reductase-like NADH-dependent reductase (Old Yellow Enzyme family)
MIDPFSPITIRGMQLPNRFMRSATHDSSADESGRATEKSLSIYSRLGEGDIGLVVNAYAYVRADGHALPGQYGAHSDEMIPSLARLAEAVHRGGGRTALQIVHAGIYSPALKEKGVVCLAPSKVENSEYPHREMTAGEIEAIIEDFGAAAARAREAGFDAVQLHGAHGYLFSQFLSPLTNRRTDGWGGSLERRRRFHIEAVREVRRRVGDDYPVMIKFGIMDDAPGGTTLEDGIDTAGEMVGAGVDAIEVSFGIGGDFMVTVVGKPANAENEKPWFRERAAALKRAVSVPVAVVGGIRSFDMAREILDAGEADLISMSRPFIREPGLISRWLAGDRSPTKCITCLQCYRLMLGNQDVLDSYCWQESGRS